MYVRLVVLTLGFGICDPIVAADLDPVAQKAQQKKVAAELEQTARRIGTTLRVMAYQKIDRGTEQKMLDEVATTLRGLSQEQIQGVLKHLDAAIKAPDEATASAEQQEAYQKHRQIVTSLRGLVNKLDILKSLDQAANRLDKFSKDQHGMHLNALHAETFKPIPGRTVRARDDREEQADSQGDLRNELMNLVKQLGLLKATLTVEQKSRLDSADAFGKGGQLLADMELSSRSLNGGDFRGASERQLRTAKELQALAAALRTPRDKIAAMKEARDKIEKTIQAEKQLKNETEQAKKPDQKKGTERDRFERYAQDPAKVEAHKLADQQAKIEFDTRDIRKSLEELSKETATKLSPAESEMKRAQEELRNNTDPEKAVEPEANAEKRLTEARDELDQQIAQAEKEKSDTLAATKKAAEMVDKLIQEQKKLQQQTNSEQKPDNLAKLAEKQQDIAKQANELKNLPLPNTEQAKQALTQATKEAKDAAKDLERLDKPAAMQDQADTLKALEDAKQALADKAKEIEQRRDDLKKLEDAAKKLNELAKQENKLAKDAAENAEGDKKKSDDLAKQQEKITPETEKVGESVKDAAPDAAKKIEESTEAMKDAKKSLEKNEPMPGAEQAKDAAKKLEEAGKELAKKADELKAQELADQAALQPNQISPADAAQQLAKAIEQANKASEEAKKSAEQLGQKPNSPTSEPKPNLAELQKQIAKQAEKLNQTDAAKNAEAAAEALEKGDIGEAIEQQQQAMEKLDAAAKGEPTPAEAQGSPMPANAKNSGELAKNQEQVKKATEALAKSALANMAAQAALQQAQANAPMGIQPQLGQANDKLNEAKEQLGESMPMEAGDSQQKAAEQLTQALEALNAAAQQLGQPTSKPGQPKQAQGQPMPGKEGQQPGDKPGEGEDGEGKDGKEGKKPGDKPGKDGKDGKSDEKNENKGEGDRKDGGKLKDGTPNGKSQEGDGSFINLQKRERDKVQQNAEAAFPAEFREMLKQYNINIKNSGKMQSKKPEEKKKD